MTEKKPKVYRGYTISEEIDKEGNIVHVAKRYHKNGIQLKHKVSAKTSVDLIVKIDDVFNKGTY